MKHKSRMVSFRISAEEYDRLRQAAAQAGASNLSELARVAMHRLLNGDPAEPAGLPEQVHALRLKIQDISQELERLSQAVPRAAAAASQDYAD